jgi:hypothetical protein
MSKFKLVCDDESIPFGPSKIRHEFETTELTHILSNMTKFLQTTGYLDNNKQLTFERTVNLFEDEDLDDYTESLFTNTGDTDSVSVDNTGAISGTIVTGTPISKE